MSPSQKGLGDEDEHKTSKKGSVRYASKDQDDNLGPVPSSQSSSAPPDNADNDFDDFDPRGSSTTGAAAVKSNKVDLFGESLIDFTDAPTSVPTEKTTNDSNTSEEVDLFADATFVSAAPHAEAKFGSHSQANIDLFPQSSLPGPTSSTVDLFATSDPSLPAVTRTSKSELPNPSLIDPFAAMPLNSFEGSDLFGDFTSHAGPASTEPKKGSSHVVVSPETNTKTTLEPPPKKDNFQVKSGIWADSLSRGLIDLNISAPKKVSLADIGVVGDLSGRSDK